MKRKGKQAQLGTSLSALVRRLDKRGGGGYIQTRVAQAWRNIAGPSVEGHTTGEHLRSGGELVVLVDSPLWATELSALAEHYRTSMNQELGEDLVKAVRFTVSKRVQSERRIEQAIQEGSDHLTEDKVDPIDLTPQELAQVEASAAGIPDQQLREAVLKATVADLQWKKGLKARRERETPRDGL